jgi:hypothetical protein
MCLLRMRRMQLMTLLTGECREVKRKQRQEQERERLEMEVRTPCGT